MSLFSCWRNLITRTRPSHPAIASASRSIVEGLEQRALFAVSAPAGYSLLATIPVDGKTGAHVIREDISMRTDEQYFYIASGKHQIGQNPTRYADAQKYQNVSLAWVNGSGPHLRANGVNWWAAVPGADFEPDTNRYYTKQVNGNGQYLETWISDSYYGDNDGGLTLQVYVKNLAPVIETVLTVPEAASSEDPIVVGVGETVTISGTFSDPDSEDSWAVTLDNGDGTDAVAGDINAGSMEYLTTTSYDTPGTYTAVLTITDNNGATDTETRSVTVLDRPNIIIDSVPEEDEESTGAYVPLNNDDDDGDDVIDLEEGVSILGENNLVPMQLVLPSSWETGVDGTVTLAIDQGASCVKVWTNSDKSDGLVLGGSTTEKTWSRSEMPSTLWVEGIATTTVEIAIFTLLCQAGNSTPAVKPDKAVVKVFDGPIALEDNQAGVIGGVVPSVKKEGVVSQHFVTPKAAEQKVWLRADVQVPEGKTFDEMYAWEGGDAVAGAPEKRSVSRSAAGKYVVKLKDKDGNVLSTVTVWVVWATLEATPRGISDLPAPIGASLSAGYNFTATIHPATIVTDQDRPKLSGERSAVPPGGKNYADMDLAEGASMKWDMSRQLRQKHVQLPAGWQITDFVTPETHREVANYPESDIVGNDDASVGDEDNDPYAPAHIAKITSWDEPEAGPKHAKGAVGDQIEIRSQFREFARLNLDAQWYRISDFQEWQVDFKLTKRLVSEDAEMLDLNGDGDREDMVPLWRGSLDADGKHLTTAALDNGGW